MRKFAALRGTTIDAVLYIGQEFFADYPDWFVEHGQGYWVDADGETLFRDPKGGEDWESPLLYMVPMGTVVLRNSNGDIQHLDLDRFSDDFIQVGSHHAALKNDVVEYECYQDWVFVTNRIGKEFVYTLEEFQEKFIEGVQWSFTLEDVNKYYEERDGIE